jgi:hypothetical protein
MPLYFFNFSQSPDPEPRRFKNDGLELIDDAAAWEEATTACGEKLREIDGALSPGDGWTMEVSDSLGKLIYVLTFDSRAL